METGLRIDGAVAEPLSFSLGDLRHAFPTYTIETSYVHDEHIVTATFSGARLWDILMKAQVLTGALQDSTLRVKGLASDGVRSVIHWHEFDPLVTDRIVLVAYEQNGQPLSSNDGPLRLVVPGDLRGRRYLRGLVKVTVLTGEAEEDE